MDSQENVKSSEGDWSKCESKSHPGRFYLFNKKTLESKWCGETPQDIPQASTLPATVTNSALCTPEQDRLKRLEKKLNDETPKRKAKKRSAESEPVSKSTEVINDDNGIPDQNPAYPCTSTALNIGSGIVSGIKGIFGKAKNFLMPRKTDVCKISTDTTDDEAMNPSQCKRIKCESSINSSEQRECEETNDENQPIVAELTLDTKHNSTDTTDDEAMNPSQCKRIKCESSINSSEQRKCEITNDENQQIVADLTLDTKQISAHMVQNTLVQIEMEKDEQVLSNNNTLPSKLSSEHLKQDSWLKIKHEQDVHYGSNTNILYNKNSLTNVVHNSFMQLRQQQAVANNNSVEMAGNSWSEIALDTIALDSKAMEQTQEFITSNISVSSSELDSANARLLNLRKSLPEIAQADSKLLNTSTEAKSTSSNLTFMFHENIANGQQAQDDALLQDYAIDSTTTEESSINEAIESNIEPIRPDEQNTELGKKNYDTVNENLLRFVEGRKQDQTECTLLLDHYYFVLDTNVLLSHITFIEDLRGMKLCDTNGTVLYIPYCVLQELDKLKQYSAREGTKELAKRAAKYLLSKFKSNDKHIQVQSAVSDMEHIIEITSADDKILNCCLQVQKTICNVVLLTEDINLRNKAICNNISVSTKSDLVSKRF